MLIRRGGMKNTGAGAWRRGITGRWGGSGDMQPPGQQHYGKRCGPLFMGDIPADAGSV